jgi:hypothetical protein
MIATLFLTLSIVFIHAQTDEEGSATGSDNDYFNYIEQQKLSSSLYSKPEDDTVIDPSMYIPIEDSDTLVSENASLELYLNEETLNFKIKDKDTDYVWSTALKEPDAGNYDGLLSSGIGIEYINKEQNMSENTNIGLVDTEFTLDVANTANGVSIDVSIGGYCSTRNCSRLYDDYVDGVYDLDHMIQLGLTEIDVAFTLDVSLTDTGITAHIPYESITQEEDEWTTLSSIILFPSLGATRLDDIPGYMVIPDGVGAIIRYEDNFGQYGTPFEERFYGENLGLESNRQSVTSYPLSMPIFGAVHGHAQHAMTAIIESGDINARLLAYPNGSGNQDYNLVFPKFDLRQTYRQSFTSDGSGGARRVADTLSDDITVHYDFSSGEAATYTGIAKTYRNYLADRNIISPLETDDVNIPLHTQYLMSDSRSRFIGNSVIEMTSVSSIERMIDAFEDANITNQKVSLMGWNSGGYSGHLPSNLDFENKLGSNTAFKDLIEKTDAYLLNNYVEATEATDNISYRRDVAQGVDRFQLEDSCDGCTYQNEYLLYPEKTKNLAMDHYEGFSEEKANMLFEALGSTVYSYYDNEIYNRSDALNYYESIMETYKGKAGYLYPNAYAYPYMDEFFGAPLFNSQLKYFDDLVPLLPIALSGHMDLYSQFMNFNSLGREQTLMLIDFNINPSFILSEEESNELSGTDIEYMFSTHFEKWESSVIEDYHYMNDALQYVRGASIESRDVLEMGVVEVTYSNGITIIINYTSQEVTYEGKKVNPLDYLVGGLD